MQKSVEIGAFHDQLIDIINNKPRGKRRMKRNEIKRKQKRSIVYFCVFYLMKGKKSFTRQIARFEHKLMK